MRYQRTNGSNRTDAGKTAGKLALWILSRRDCRCETGNVPGAVVTESKPIPTLGLTAVK